MSENSNTMLFVNGICMMNNGQLFSEMTPYKVVGPSPTTAQQLAKAMQGGQAPCRHMMRPGIG